MAAFYTHIQSLASWFIDQKQVLQLVYSVAQFFAFVHPFVRLVLKWLLRPKMTGVWIVKNDYSLFFTVCNNGKNWRQYYNTVFTAGMCGNEKEKKRIKEHFIFVSMCLWIWRVQSSLLTGCLYLSPPLSISFCPLFLFLTFTLQTSLLFKVFLPKVWTRPNGKENINIYNAISAVIVSAVL